MAEIILLSFFFIYIGVMVYYRFKKVPDGINGYEAEYLVDQSKVDFLYDISFVENGERRSELNIFDHTRKAIKEAEHFILFDVFLFNKQKADPSKHLPITDMVIKELKEKKIPRYFITDPLNISYGTEHSSPIAELKKIGVEVIFTNLDVLPDNNLVYSPFWRIFLQWFEIGRKGVIPNPLRNNKKTTLRAILKGLNVKANHRKLLVADDVVLVSSSNLHDASCYYNNVGIQLKDVRTAIHFLKAERAAAKMSGHEIAIPEFYKIKKPAESSVAAPESVKAAPLMGKEIKKRIMRDLESTVKGNRVVIGMLFMADRKIVNLIKKQALKGVEIEVILDNNKVSFHQKKSGMPNDYIAPELTEAGIKVYMFRDRINEYHSKFVYIKKNKEAIIYAGSANLTRRSLMGTNLENNIRIEGSSDFRVFTDIEAYINKVKTERFSKPFRGRPKNYKLGNIWVRLAESVGLASW